MVRRFLNFFIDGRTPLRVCLYTLALAKKCEVADTPTGVVMKGCWGIRIEQPLRSLKMS